MSDYESLLIPILQKRLPHVQVVQSAPNDHEERMLIRRRDIIETIRFLKYDPDSLMDTLFDISAIHHQDKNSSIYSQCPGSCFEIFYILRSIRFGYRLRLSVFIPEVLPSVPTVSGLYSAANWLEREMWDLFGIFVEGHSDLRRLLLYPGFVGYPLHKNYPIREKHPVVDKIPS